MKRVLFVCTGNLCRSPAAEYLLKDKLKKKGIGGVVVESAGTIARGGDKAASKSIEVARKMGIDMEDHRTQPLTRELVERADYVFVMETYHEDMVLTTAPGSAEKVFSLTRLVPKRNLEEIPDPYMGTEKFFVSVFNVIEEAVEELVKQLSEVEKGSL